MVDFINISLADGTSAAVFTRHIAYIEPNNTAAKGKSIIHISIGQTNLSIHSGFTVQELLKMVQG